MIDEKKLIDELKRMLNRMVNSDEGEGYLPAAVIYNIYKKICEQPKAGEWIPVAERLPEEHDSVFAKFKGTSRWNSGMYKKMSDTVMTTVELEDGTRKVLSTRTFDGKWSLENATIIKKKVIAWMPLPEPYREVKE